MRHRQPESGLDSTAHAEQVLHQTFLGKTARVHISDGRMVEGRLVAVDSKANVVLQGATELRVQIFDAAAIPGQENVAGQALAAPTAAPTSSRWVGMVMVQAQHILDVDVQAAWGSQPQGSSFSSATTQPASTLPPRVQPANSFPTDMSLYS